MTTSTTIDVPVELFRRDAQFYVNSARRPAVPEIVSILTNALGDNQFSAQVQVNIPRDLVERFIRKSTRPLRLPTSYRSLGSLLREALEAAPRTQEDADARDARAAEIDVETSNFADTELVVTNDEAFNDDEDEFSMYDVVGTEGDNAVDEVTVEQNESADEQDLPSDEDPVSMDAVEEELEVHSEEESSDAADDEGDLGWSPVADEDSVPLEVHSEDPDQEPTPVEVEQHQE